MSEEAPQQVMKRDGLFLFLKAAEPPWKVGLTRLLNEKLVRHHVPRKGSQHLTSTSARRSW